ncbi:transcriptional regulator, GntR family [Marinobacter antarcticus]|uniref:Transcriptional regulator, GntR family n=2 Tax=Marinobacter antarcticus TaxID=564117 RepID=A0A1M6UC38_9GAMM|nr:transcriptional regulator, GntR family [Marinobacter antarcticus]
MCPEAVYLMAIYQDIANTLEREIRGRFRAGDYLPPESELAERFSINRHTVRRALDELVHAGMVLRQHGKGTLVLEHSLEYRIGARGRFSESVQALGHDAKATVIGRQTVSVDAPLAAKMWVKPGTRVFQIDTLRSVDNQPVTLISHYLPTAHCPDLFEQYRGGSLHAYLEATYALTLERKQGLISALLPTAQESTLLQYPRNKPLLQVRSNNLCTRSGNLIEYSVSRSRADCFEYRIEPRQNLITEGDELL